MRDRREQWLPLAHHQLRGRQRSRAINAGVAVAQAAAAALFRAAHNLGDGLAVLHDVVEDFILRIQLCVLNAKR